MQILRRTLTRACAFLLLFAAPSFTQAADAPWGADYFPNVELTTHEGKKVRFFDDLIKDKVVAINFIFTSCPDVCPLETARMREVQKILGDRVGVDVFMYSISIDPETDTPEVLARYAEQYEAGPGWIFLTGKEEDITTLRTKLGLFDERTDSKDLSEHNLNLIIGNQKTGRWMKRSPFENPYILATQIGSWLHNWKLPPKSEQDYAEAPELRQIGRGESLFRTRCASCHGLGKKQMEGEGGRDVGPDLLGVTQKRGRAWLARWIADPGKLIAEKDPLATELFEAYDRVLMPNLGLNALEIEALLSYIEEESARQHDHSSHDHGKHDHGEQEPSKEHKHE